VVAPRKIAFLVFPRLTLLDFVGPYDCLRRVRTMGIDAGLQWQVIATHPEIVDDSGLTVGFDVVRPPLDDFDLLVVPGGYGVDELRHDADVMAYLQTWGETRPIASVCSGSLLLGDCDWLRNLPATTHHLRLAQLAPLCGTVEPSQRVVDAGRVVTAGGVCCGIDLGLHLVEKYWTADARARIAAQMAIPGASERMLASGANRDELRG
jgi:transcriptional regulator GlxA family with amidase domain